MMNMQIFSGNRIGRFLVAVVLSTVVLLTLTFDCSLGATFVVNSQVDSHDANPGDAIAQDILARCTFRAAIEEATTLAGADTIIVPGEYSPILLQLGSIYVGDNGTVIIGDTDYPTIDGSGNPPNSHTLILTSDSNMVEGLTFRNSRGDAVVIEGAQNIVGGTHSEQRCVFLNNGLDNDQAAAIAIEGSQAYGNAVVGCFIGMYGNGTLVDGNRNGIRLGYDTHDNSVGTSDTGEGNLISGNEGYGVTITDRSYANTITGNYIGPNISGDVGPGNDGGGILLSNGACANIVGGSTSSHRNLISANSGDGITLIGSDVELNIIEGNIIGLEMSGRYLLGNGGDGIRLCSGAHDNQVGSSDTTTINVISGNNGSGVHISGTGTENNTIIDNIIGLAINGYTPQGNGRYSGDGILIDSSARNNYIGGSIESERNTISGNIGFGVHINGPGTNSNSVTGNFIGTSFNGSSSAYNQGGVAITNGAQYNEVGGSIEGEGNVISGNRSSLFPLGGGVLIYNTGTNHNRVRGNIIGLNIKGMNALLNGSAGVIIGDGAQWNVIGGETESEGNVISGNAAGSDVSGIARGVHLFGYGTQFNRIIGNVIGLSVSGLATIGNSGHGIGLYAGASDNEIGGNRPEAGNIITGSFFHGVYLNGPGTRSNLIRYNSIYDNDSLGIAITGMAQDGVTAPTIVQVSVANVNGIGAPTGGTVDIYVAAPDPSGEGEGMLFVGSAVAGEDGLFSADIFGVTESDTLTAIATDISGNSSQFSANVAVGTSTSVENDNTVVLPLSCSLSQNYPNPFNPTTNIRYSLSKATHVELSVYSVLGRRIRTVVSEVRPGGTHETVWDGRDDQGRLVAGGVYFYRLTTDNFTASRKMLLLK